MTDGVMNRAEVANGDGGSSELPLDEMLHGVAAQSATMVSLRELLIDKGVVSRDEWNQTFQLNYRSETERYREIFKAQRVT